MPIKFWWHTWSMDFRYFWQFSSPSFRRFWSSRRGSVFHDGGVYFIFHIAGLERSQKALEIRLFARCYSVHQTLCRKQSNNKINKVVLLQLDKVWSKLTCSTLPAPGCAVGSGQSCAGILQSLNPPCSAAYTSGPNLARLSGRPANRFRTPAAGLVSKDCKLNSLSGERWIISSRPSAGRACSKMSHLAPPRWNCRDFLLRQNPIDYFVLEVLLCAILDPWCILDMLRRSGPKNVESRWM